MSVKTKKWIPSTGKPPKGKPSKGIPKGTPKGRPSPAPCKTLARKKLKHHNDHNNNISVFGQTNANTKNVKQTQTVTTMAEMLGNTMCLLFTCLYQDT